MTRYKITIQYDGADFQGWQRLPGIPSVQEALENAVFKFCGEETEVYGAGRTDAGVHALGMVAHVDIDKAVDPFRLMEAVNFHLKPLPVCILSAEPAPDGFHARFSCIERAYEYHIYNRRPRPVIGERYYWHLAGPLDAEAMQQAAHHLIGHHDFTSFRSTECTAKSPMKTLDELSVRQQGDIITITARSRSFLHNQVRIMAGTLAEVGLGKRQPSDMPSILTAKNRSAAGQTAPPDGLFFTRARYEKSS
ncbi:tRNA pseudouridine(38-40) synthase TruA [bacterium]|nr:tRNA pseudouridine(38-40) synthase TruA [bacterium]